MNKKGYKVKAGIVLLSSAIMLSGCSFVPETEEVRVAPVAQTLEQVYFEQVEVTCEDISSKFELNVTYKTKKMESLCFILDENSKVFIETNYFVEGDEVKQGDLLAEADSSKLKESIDSLAVDIEERQKTVDYYAKLVEIEESRKNIYAQYGVEFDDTNLVSYQETLDTETKLLNVSILQHDEAKQELENLRVYAPFDGTLSFIKTPNRWQEVKKGEVIATVVQDNERITTTSTENEYIEVGGIYNCELVTEKIEFKENTDESFFNNEVSAETLTENIVIEVVCKSIECLNEESGTYEYVFVPVDSSILEEYDNIPQGKVVVVLETVENATVVPKDVIITTADGHAVYLEAEDGSRTIQNVEIGIIEGDKVQILSGLEVGQTVIGEKIDEEEVKGEKNK